MARTQLTRTSVLLLGGATTLAIPRRTAFAESPQKDELPEKKPIYSSLQNATPTPKPAKITDPLTNEPPNHTPTPTDRLQGQIKRARLFLHDQSIAVEDAFNAGLTWAFRKETNIANTIASLAPAPETGEQLLPGVIYVLVATMAGSIVSRNRNILIRATFPLAVGITAGWWLIPVTMQNTGDLIWEYEKKVPVISETHAQIAGFTREAWKQSKIRAEALTQWSDKKASESRRAVEGWVERGR